MTNRSRLAKLEARYSANRSKVEGWPDDLITSYLGVVAVQKIVTYFRVSTAKQGRSGLGMEGQQAAVDAFVARRGCEVLASYTEVESGKRADRPELAKALAHAKRSKATLVVAKLDRLARNVAFLSRLMESGCDFIAIDLEHANRLTIHILSAVAEGEAKAISDRTKAALQAAKARGAKLGSARPGHWEGRESARLKGSAKGEQQQQRLLTRRQRTTRIPIYCRSLKIYGQKTRRSSRLPMRSTCRATLPDAESRGTTCK